MNPTNTGGVAITTVMLAGLIVWLCSVLKIQAPPMDVAGTIAALLMYAGHQTGLFIRAYFPPKVAPAPVAAPATPTA